MTIVKVIDIDIFTEVKTKCALSKELTVQANGFSQLRHYIIYNLIIIFNALTFKLHLHFVGEAILYNLLSDRCFIL